MSYPNWKKESHPSFVNWYPVHAVPPIEEGEMFSLVTPPQEEFIKMLQWHNQAQHSGCTINPDYPVSE